MQSFKLFFRQLAPLAAIGLLAFTQAAQAQVVGTVTDLAGVLVARRTDGVKLLSTQSQVRQGDTLVTGAGTYARMRFVDGAELILQPDSRLVLTRYVYEATNPKLDSVQLSLEQGGFLSAAGELGARSKDAIIIDTPSGQLKGSATLRVSLQQP